MLTLTNAFASDGTHVDLVLANAEGPYLKDIESSVRLIDLQSARVLKSLPGLIAYLRRERPVAMLTAMTHANLIAILAIFLSGVNTRLVISERVDLFGLDKTEKFFKRLFIAALMRLSYPRAYRLVAVSKGVASGLLGALKLPAMLVDVIYNPVNLKRIARLSQELPAHPWLSDGGPPVIIAAGRLSVQKDFALLINAFAELRRQTPARLIIIGEGEERKNLTALIHSLKLETEIALPGFVDNPYAYLRAASVFVLSSRWEGLPNALIEAMACGLPVVSTDCPSGPMEILENGKWGRLVPVGDQHQLAIAISESLHNPQYPPIESLREFSDEATIAKYRKLLLA